MGTGAVIYHTVRVEETTNYESNLPKPPVLTTEVYDIGGWQAIAVVIGIVAVTLALGWWILKYKELE